MHNKYTKFFSKKNIEYQFRLLFFTAILIPIVVLGSIINLTLYRNIETNYESLTQSKASQINTALVMTSINFHQLAFSLATDEDLMCILQAEHSSEKRFIEKLSDYKVLSNTLTGTPSIADLKLYISSDKLPMDIPARCFYRMTDDDKTTEWYMEAKGRSDGFWMTEKRSGKGNVAYWELNYYCKLKLPLTGEFVILKATLSDNYIRSLLERDNYDIYLSTDDGVVFFSTDRDYTGGIFPFERPDKANLYSESGISMIRGNKTIFSACSVKPYMVTAPMHILVCNNRFYSQLIFIIAVMYMLVIIISIVSFLIIFFYGKYFIGRIKTLRLAMHKVSNNDYRIIDSISGEDELTYAFEDLKKMVDDLKEKEAAIYQSRIEEEMLTNRQQQMELKLLAGQINPHFLYNTMEMIRMKALTEGNRSVATAIKRLGNCMRYALSNTISTSTAIIKEIEYLNNYLAIMKMRFGERLNYMLRIDPHIDTENTQILPLLIQPIVENAIIHGLESTGNPGTLIIRLSIVNEKLLKILVFDNGVGISKEKLSELKASLSIPPAPNAKHGIGMYNTNSRMQKYYGERYGIKLYSKLGCGTIVTAVIPLR